MARHRGDGPVTLSILDRLIDEDPKNSHEAPLTRAQSIRELKAGVRRDLEWLLNTRQPAEGVPPGLDQVRRSLYNYGLPDITSANLGSSNGRDTLNKAMQQAVLFFEPRLDSVRVSLTTVAGEKTPQLRFTIEGMLRMDPAPEPISFDTLLEISNGEYKVQG